MSTSSNTIEQPEQPAHLTQDTLMHNVPSQPATGRHCFVTIGSIANFRPLLDEVVTPDFLACLASHGYSTLTVQCGPELEQFREKVAALATEDIHGIDIRSFDYTPSLIPYMLECRGEAGTRLAGCVISHAGSGTILEVKRVNATLIAVPNPTLMDNHQLELAEELSRQNWAIHGHIGHLTSAVQAASQKISSGKLDSLPPYSAPPFPVPAEQRTTLFDWVALTCYPAEFQRQSSSLSPNTDKSHHAALSFD
ncbi:hypothetical protein QBC35DRAFT_35866 [Podospora australis]|uniref:UDP-N-acetylglucosamine transferase subunit ALG13 n=1 Tax=Podospora australis TaxID=1536484 RepID=A0AAN6WZJ6_9PEZI|nr:hypothetical protein QBC35DRAFT_35866 [Podospora australis]